MDGADSVTEYEYDENGNLTKDLNRNILSIQYDSLNLQSKIAMMGGTSGKQTSFFSTRFAPSLPLNRLKEYILDSRNRRVASPTE